MVLQIFNTLTRRKEAFVPIDPKEVRMYTCGPTVYHYAHIGNLRSYLFSDVLRRVLEWNSYVVKHVMNITDVGHLTDDADHGDDKMEVGASREGRSVWDIAQYYTDAFMKDMEQLHILSPTIWCKATDHIQEQIDQVKQLEEKGFTYVTSDGVYFDTSKLEDYGKLALLKLEDLQAGKRIDLGEKRNKTDFALWKFSPQDAQRQMEWDSPWGRGFPGWHIECSAMSVKYLGDQFDIHTGGIDHVPVHHTNEIAQAECALGVSPWVKYWMHGEFLVLEKDKMSKSSGEFIRLQTFIDKGYDPLVYRYFVFNAHYRKALTFTWDAIESASHGFEGLRKKIISLQGDIGEIHEGYVEKFSTAVNDDLNMPQALAVLWELLRDENVSISDRYATALRFDDVFGFGFSSFAEEEVDVPAQVMELVREREGARSSKDWAKADELREKIRSFGFDVADSKEGTQVTKLS